MAYPSLIQKMMDVSRRVEDTHCANIAMGRQMLALCNRLIEIELYIAEGAAEGKTWEGSLKVEHLIAPEGVMDSGGAIVAPFTMVRDGANPIPGAALTAIVSEVR